VTQERLDFVPPSPQRGDGTVASGLGWRASLHAHRRAWMAIRGVREIVLIGGTYTLYDLTRYLVAGDHDQAFGHGHSVLRFEQRIHFDPEHALNRFFSAHLAIGLPADYIYATLHYILTPLILIWLWRRYPDSYSFARTLLIITTLIGLVGFALFPVAPPRLLGGFIDTMAKYSHYGWWSTAGSAPRGFGADTNQYAAMPSLHVGWALWSGYQLVRHGRHRVTQALGVCYPLVLSVVVMGTGNHYLLDVLAGVAVVGIAAVVTNLVMAVIRRIWPDHISAGQDYPCGSPVADLMPRDAPTAPQ
jgi:PAP2 superfamily